MKYLLLALGFAGVGQCEDKVDKQTCFRESTEKCSPPCK
jgi:hypothetical protein